jgi:putative endonuclease
MFGFFCLNEYFNMSHYLYILHSKKADKYYIGESPNLENRHQQHINHHFSKSFTKIADDWEVVLSKKCDSKQDALFLEAFIKRMKSKKFIIKVVENSNILDDILNKK